MTKITAPKKVKKSPTIESDGNEYDVSIFEIRDRHYSSLLAVKKKIRACEKKIRELEQVTTSHRASIDVGNQFKNPSQVEMEERLNKLENKKMQLSIWKEAAVCIHNVRKEELTQGVTNVSMADVVDGIDLLRRVVDNESKWDHYKCPNKKHLQKVDIERIRQLARYLGIQPSTPPSDVAKPSPSYNSLPSFTTVVDFLSSPIAIGQECPMSFSEFVRMFDKLRKTLLVDIVVKEQTAVAVESIAPTIIEGSESTQQLAETATTTTTATTNVITSEKPFKSKNNRQKRSSKGPKLGRKSQNGSTNNDASSSVAANQNPSLPSVPEKLVVVVTNNAKHKQQTDDLSNTTNNSTPNSISIEDFTKSTSANVNYTHKPMKHERSTPDIAKEIPSGRLIHHPNVPTDDSDEEGWIVPPSNKQKKPVVVESNNYRQQQNAPPRRGNGNNRASAGGNQRNGSNTRVTNNNGNYRRGPNSTRKNNNDNHTNNYKNKRPQTVNRPAEVATVIETEGQLW